MFYYGRFYGNMFENVGLTKLITLLQILGVLCFASICYKSTLGDIMYSNSKS